MRPPSLEEVTQIILLTSPLPGQSVEIKPGQIVLVRIPRDIPTDKMQQVAEQLSCQIKRCMTNALPDGVPLGDQVHLIFCYDDINVESLDERMMAQAGWYRGEPPPNPPF